MLVCQNRLETEKIALMTELNKLQKEKEVWALQRSELEMTQAELSAENSQLRSELNSKVLTVTLSDSSLECLVKVGMRLYLNLFYFSVL